MPPKYVKTIREEIYYEYAKLICRSVYGSIDGRIQRCFITNRFKDLRDSRMTISGTISEWTKEQSLPHECVYCGAKADFHRDHLIPKSRGGLDSSDNVVWACESCNTSRGNKGIFEWLDLKKKDQLHRLVAGKYLKQLLELHENAGTLDMAADNIVELCCKCGLGKVCQEFDSVQKLTCLCLESIIPTKQ